MDALTGEHRGFDNKFLDVAKFTTLTPLSLLISCELSFPIVGLKNISGSLHKLRMSHRMYFSHYKQNTCVSQI
jgi:hypothetical protein